MIPKTKGDRLRNIVAGALAIVVTLGVIELIKMCSQK